MQSTINAATTVSTRTYMTFRVHSEIKLTEIEYKRIFRSVETDFMVFGKCTKHDGQKLYFAHSI
jgi:hypothetical protein